LGEGKNNEALINSVIIRESHMSPVRGDILGKQHIVAVTGENI